MSGKGNYDDNAMGEIVSTINAKLLWRTVFQCRDAAIIAVGVYRWLLSPRTETLGFWIAIVHRIRGNLTKIILGGPTLIKGKSKMDKVVPCAQS